MADEALIQTIKEIHKDDILWLETNGFNEPQLESGHLSSHRANQYYVCAVYLYADMQTGGMISVYETPVLDDIVKATNKVYENTAKSLEHECEHHRSRMKTTAELDIYKMMDNLKNALPPEAELVNIEYELREKYNAPSCILTLEKKEETADKRVNIKKGSRSAEDTYWLIRKVSKTLGIEPEREH